MRSKKAILFLWAMTAVTSAVAQNNSSFQDFRKNIFENYNNFRNSILENYDKFLENAWSEYNSIRGESSSPVPKPSAVPSVTEVPPASPQLTDLPEAVPAHGMPKTGEDAPSAPTEIPPAPSAERPAAKPFAFPFFGMEMQMPSIDFNIAKQLSGTREYAAQWRNLEKDGNARKLLPYVEELAGRYALNDYLKYELLSAYVHKRFANDHVTSRMSLLHYLLANMGYDVRIAVNGNGHPLILIPFRQDVYARPYLVLDNRKYYIFSDTDLDMGRPENTRISTCDLPSHIPAGAIMDLTLNGLNLPYEPYRYDIAFGGLRIQGEVNKNIFPVLFKYPQMPTGDFARSEVCPDVRRSIVEQLGPQLAGKPQNEAIDALLKFVQGFDYATDEEYHGFEKPYFFEEMLYYAKCDCEDRAIFYTYLLWNVLGVENHLICYPGHESAAVHLSENIRGDAYDYEGRRFYISDPTYIGASTGMCMPMYVRESPQIDYIYKKK